MCCALPSKYSSFINHLLFILFPYHKQFVFYSTSNQLAASLFNTHGYHFSFHRCTMKELTIVSSNPDFQFQLLTQINRIFDILAWTKSWTDFLFILVHFYNPLLVIFFQYLQPAFFVLSFSHMVCMMNLSNKRYANSDPPNIYLASFMFWQNAEKYTLCGKKMYKSHDTIMFTALLHFLCSRNFHCAMVKIIVIFVHENWCVLPP